MKSDWRRMCRGADIKADDDSVTVIFGNDRKHVIRVVETDEEFRVWAVIARQATVAEQEDLELRIWEKNHGSKLVTYRIDEKGRLIGEAWVPKAGLTDDEFRLYARKVAAECDRFEYLLTGRDLD